MGPDDLLLGIDGGNTKSIALVAAQDGTIAGAGRSPGSSDIHAEPVDVAIGRLEAAADAALRAAGAGDSVIAAAGFSLAGADWPEDVALLRSRLAQRWPADVVVNDAVGALRAAIPHGPGVVVVCGTGAATAARGADGRTWHSSFWQETQGAHELGVRALQAVVRSELGIDPPTALTSRVPAALGEPDVAALLHRLTGRSTRGRGEQAALAAVLLDAADLGDRAAVAIAREHGASLGRMALAAARRVGIDGQPFALALAGGVIRHSGRTLRDAIVGTVQAAAPGTTVVTPTLEPAVGALLLAFDLARIPVTRAVDARLRATLPPVELWDTRPAAGISAP
jgi:N-acetylglucosamine kinase-like BadF-type ATPase